MIRTGTFGVLLSTGWRAAWLSIAMMPFVARGAEASAALEDLATRLQFDFYSGDVRALQRDTDAISRAQASAEARPAQLMWTAYGHWKQAEMLRASNPEAAGQAVNACIESLEAALRLNSDRADALAMLALCYGLASQVRGRLRQPLALTRMRQTLSHAIDLSPRHPQVLLSAAINEFERPRQGLPDTAAVEQKLKAAIDAYESPAYARESTLWGQAEAWAYLGRMHLSRNDSGAARDAFEHALVLVADYADVQRLLQQALRGASVP